MNQPSQYVPEPIEFTAAAANRARALIEDDGNPDLKLRVFISGGGCSGFEYGFTFDEDVEDEDTRIDSEGVTLVVDSMSYQYLMGAQVDFKQDLQGSRFIVTNPNAATTCGCGNSFSI